jgi:hypothetical protein
LSTNKKYPVLFKKLLTRAARLYVEKTGKTDVYWNHIMELFDALLMKEHEYFPEDYPAVEFLANGKPKFLYYEYRDAVAGFLERKTDKIWIVKDDCTIQLPAQPYIKGKDLVPYVIEQLNKTDKLTFAFNNVQDNEDHLLYMQSKPKAKPRRHVSSDVLANVARPATTSASVVSVSPLPPSATTAFNQGVTIGENDYVAGGGKHRNRQGNKQFVEIVSIMMQTWVDASMEPGDKKPIFDKIFAAVKALGGRFLDEVGKESGAPPLYVVIPHDKVDVMIKQAFKNRKKRLTGKIPLYDPVKSGLPAHILSILDPN